ncbi:hypothetical protein D3C81_2080580 [compost metagenome]
MDINRVRLLTEVRADQRKVHGQKLVHERMRDEALLAVAQVIDALAILDGIGDGRIERGIPVEL